ncbi:DNA-binding transcriptional regulator, AcrR family [Mycolicibacterium neoaurum]|uniref:TetR/AcrR family transcriptional regulator n=1 Tax=Mycolicibacterium neoaurum TaxID=1795 RepID=UPI000560C754|nr:TetR/AcrR family transcriptional regulator [Mycolicibacterium neoaurum]SDC43617.1 DNA-binding transcriptional regulator, AcrR family [Mycolicibacterium neoaurum]
MDPRAQRTVDALLDAAERLFGEKALADVTVEEIATGAGVAVGSIYNHFGSKAGLHAALVERALVADRAHMDRAYVEGRSPVDQIRSAAIEYMNFAIEQPEHFRMLAFPPDPGRYPAGLRTAEVLAQRVAEQNDRLVVAIRAGVATGELRPVDAERAATALWAAWNGIISLAWRPDGLRHAPDELRRLLGVAVDLVENGLLARA